MDSDKINVCGNGHLNDVQNKKGPKYTKNAIPNSRKFFLKRKHGKSAPRYKGLSKTDRYITQQSGVFSGTTVMESLIKKLFKKKIYKKHFERSINKLNLELQHLEKQGGVLSMDSDTSQAITSALERVNEIGHDNSSHLGEVLKEVVDKVGTLLENPVNINHNIKIPQSGCLDGLLDFVRKHKRFVAVVVIVCICYFAVTYKGEYSTLIKIATTIGLIYFAKQSNLIEWLKDIMEYFKGISSAPDVVQQSGTFEDILPRLGLAGIFCNIFRDLRYTDTLDLVQQFANRCYHLKRYKEGLQFGISSFLELIQEVLNLIADKMQWKTISIKSDPFWNVKMYVDEVKTAIGEYEANPLRDSIFCGRLTQLVAQGEELRQKVFPMPNSTPQILLLTETLRKIDVVLKELSGRLVNVTGQRPEPFMLVITGAPGIGKTSFVNKFWADITAETLEVDKLDHFLKHTGEYMYTFNQKDAYYSGYNGQYNMLVDELGFLHDVPGDNSVWADLIQWVNVNPMNLNMADLAHKGRTFFRSKFIWGSTNRKHFGNIASVEEKQAVYRRLQYTYIAAPKPIFCTTETAHLGIWDRQTDFSKVMDTEFSHNYDFLEFYRMTDVGLGTYHNEPISVDELTDIVLTENRRRVNLNHIQLSGMKTSIEEIANRRKAIFKQSGISCGSCPKCNKQILLPSLLSMQEVLKKMNMSREPFTIHGKSYTIETFTSESYDRAYTMIGMDGYTDCVLGAMTLDDWWNSFLFNGFSNSIRKQAPVFDLFSDKTWGLIDAGITVASYLLAGFASFKLISLFISWIQSFFSSSRQDGIIPEGDGTYAIRERQVKRGKRSRRFQPKLVSQQGGDDPNAANIAAKLASRSIWRYKIYENESKCHQGCVVVLQNNVVMMPQHYIDQWAMLVSGDHKKGIKGNPNIQITFYNSQFVNSNTGEMKHRQFTRTLKDLLPLWDDEEQAHYGKMFGITTCDDDDVGIYVIPGITGPNITKLFRSRDQKIPINHTGILVTVNAMIAPTFNSGHYKLVDNLAYADGTWACEKGIVYDINTRKGDCGSLFLINDKSSEGKIAAMHIGGVGNVQGLAIIVDRESIEAGLEFALTLNNLLKDVGSESAHPDCVQLIDAQGGCVAEGRPLVECKVKRIPQMLKTKIIPSPINGVLPRPPKEKPAMLRFTNGIDPMENAKWGYGTSFCRPNLNAYNAAKSYVASCIFDVNVVLEDGFRRTLSYEEAVMGIPGEEFLDAINRKTSPGWPMKHILPQGSKRAAFGTEEFEFGGQWDLKVRDHVNHLEGCILKGIRPFVLNNHFLKDETRPIEKADSGNTRLISSSDLVFNISLRKHTLMFCCYLMRSRIQNGSAVGTNSFSDDWNHIAFRLGNGKPNWRIIAGDMSKFDKGLAPDDFWFIADLMNLFYNDAGSRSYIVRNGLMQELAQSRHADGENVYSWMGGNSSGNGMTTPINTFTLQCLIYYVILLEHPDKPTSVVQCHRILKGIGDKVRTVCYGDDLLIAVQTNSEFGWVNDESIQRGFAQIGMKYTNEMKTGTMLNYDRNLSEVTFLKRHFYKTCIIQPNRWMAALSLDTILESIQWTKDHDVGFQFWKDNVNNMLKELSAHPYEIFKFWSEKIVTACRESDVKFQPELLDYKSYQELFMSTEHYY